MSDSIDSGLRDRPAISADDIITIGMASAGSRLLKALLSDPDFMREDNAHSEAAARVFKAMLSACPREKLRSIE